MPSFADQLRRAVIDATPYRGDQQRLCEATGISPAVLSRFIAGERDSMSFDAVAALIQYLRLRLTR